MMRTMTKRIMNEEMMSNPMRMKVTIKMATNTMGLIFKHAHKLCDEACSCKAFSIMFIIYCSNRVLCPGKRFNVDLEIRIKIRNSTVPVPT
jgi:hypothetical protein